jgi:hypothetical protein
MSCDFAALYREFVFLLGRKSPLRCRKTYMFAHLAALLRRFKALHRTFAYMLSDQASLLRFVAALQHGQTHILRHQTAHRERKKKAKRRGFVGLRGDRSLFQD